MDALTIGIITGVVIATGLLGLLVFLGFVMLVMVMRRKKGSATTQTSESVVAEPTAAPAEQASTAGPLSTGGAVPPPAPVGGGLIGFFDDAPTKKLDNAKTELFQRGAMSVDWDDEEDEAEATEIFSAHGAAGDLAEYATLDDD